MQLLTVRHVTTYRYRHPVSFGEHRLMVRPRDSYDQRLLEANLHIIPEPSELRWVHDVFGNCVAIARFSGTACELRFDSTIRLDHSRSLTVAHGMTVARLRQQMTKIRALNARAKRFQLLMGAEVDILSDGAMDYPNDVLAGLDFVVGSIHSGFTQGEAAITRRVVTAMRNPYVTLIAHPTGRLMGQREPYPVDLEAVYRTAKETGTALEINAYPKRLDLCDTAARRANGLGVMLAISTDTHSVDQLEQMAIGLGVARRAWIEPKHLLNCRSRAMLLQWIARKRASAGRRG